MDRTAHLKPQQSPDAKGRTPDVLVQQHMVPLAMACYPLREIPRSRMMAKDLRQSMCHETAKSVPDMKWSVSRCTMERPKAAMNFFTCFVENDSSVWGRPVGVAIDKDGSMFVTDDGSRSIWPLRQYESK